MHHEMMKREERKGGKREGEREREGRERTTTRLNKTGVFAYVFRRVFFFT
jgi:hypothetical protein